ncbi:MAG: hypothetical protein ACI9T7_000158 [Oleiphilaceae bacterium]|jgi:hypothetical protein
MDDFDLDAFNNMDFDAVEKTIEANQAEKDKSETEEMILLRENANFCPGGSCAI